PPGPLRSAARAPPAALPWVTRPRLWQPLAARSVGDPARPAPPPPLSAPPPPPPPAPPVAPAAARARPRPPHAAPRTLQGMTVI
ncbi:MAG: hypothetical protein AN484_27915, partial [Aphanizomenon flos-aquae WA102]